MVFGFGLKLLNALGAGETRKIGHARRSLDASVLRFNILVFRVLWECGFGLGVSLAPAGIFIY